MADIYSSTSTSLSCMPIWVSDPHLPHLHLTRWSPRNCHLESERASSSRLPPGLAEKSQLLKLNVPATFMLVALDEGPGPPIKYQYAELGKLYTVVSQLVRCCEVSSRMQSSINGECVNVDNDSRISAQ